MPWGVAEARKATNLCPPIQLLSQTVDTEIPSSSSSHRHRKLVLFSEVLLLFNGPQQIHVILHSTAVVMETVMAVTAMLTMLAMATDGGISALGSRRHRQRIGHPCHEQHGRACLWFRQRLEEI